MRFSPRHSQRSSGALCVLLAVLAFASSLVYTPPGSAAELTGAALRRKQQTQQRARAMARELVSSMLDVQLQQLEENGMADLPLHKDIANMRTNIDGLVEAEMREVV